MRKPHFRRKTRNLKQSHSAEKCKSGDPLRFLTSFLLHNIKQNEEGPKKHLKIFDKKSQCRKNRNGDP